MLRVIYFAVLFTRANSYYVLCLVGPPPVVAVSYMGSSKFPYDLLILSLNLRGPLLGNEGYRV